MGRHREAASRRRALGGGVRVGLLGEASRATLSPGQSPDSVCVQEKLHLPPLPCASHLELPASAPRPLLSRSPSVGGNVAAQGASFLKRHTSQRPTRPSLPREEGWGALYMWGGVQPEGE